MSFRATTLAEENHIVVSLTGDLTGSHSDLPQIDAVGLSSVRLDLEKFSSINSIGITKLMRWMHAIEGAPVEIHNAPKFFVDQINMIEKLLPPGGRVMSFFVPFFCEDNGVGTNVLYRRGQEYVDEAGGIRLQHPQVRDENGNVYERDVIDGRFFKFLDRGV